MDSIWETQAMEEAARNAEWERLNEEEPEEKPEFDFYGVYYALGEALEVLSKAYYKLAEAEGKAEGFNVMADIELMKDDAEDLYDRVQKLRDNLDKEVKTA